MTALSQCVQKSRREGWWGEPGRDRARERRSRGDTGVTIGTCHRSTGALREPVRAAGPATPVRRRGPRRSVSRLQRPGQRPSPVTAAWPGHRAAPLQTGPFSDTEFSPHPSLLENAVPLNLWKRTSTSHHSVLRAATQPQRPARWVPCGSDNAVTV